MPAVWRKNLKTKAYIFDSLKKIAEREKGIKTLSATPLTNNAPDYWCVILSQSRFCG